MSPGPTRSAVTVADTATTTQPERGKAARPRAKRRVPAEREKALVTIEVNGEEERQEVQALLDYLLPQIRDHNARVKGVLDAILPPETLLGPGAAAQSRRNAVLREAIGRDHGLYSAADVAELAGSRASNSAATANRWRTAGKIFSVSVGSMQLYPGFQFDDDGAPVPQVAPLLEILGPTLRGWELAAWIVQPLEELGDEAPISAWVNHPDAVLAAARAHVELINE